MCEFMDSLGWLSMSPSEQWDITLKMIGAGTVIWIAWRTSRQWQLAKIIEIEMVVCENLAKMKAQLAESQAVLAQTEDAELASISEKYVKENSEAILELQTKKVSLHRLRKLNKRMIIMSNFSDKYREIIQG